MPPVQQLSVDQAVADFCTMLKTELGTDTASPFSPAAAETPEEAEARHFRCAEELLRAVCPDPTGCPDQRCRRGGQCRHLADLRARQQGRQGPPRTRRTPGAAALRQAIWVFMQERRLRAGRDGEAAEGGARNAEARQADRTSR
jgi:hypothetical protein